eukprot:COSAG05_NODE_4548_length_1468_cov_158.428780_2_plen_274_part_00
MAAPPPPLSTISGDAASRLAIGGGPDTSQREAGLLHAAHAAGVNFFYWASGNKSPEFAADFKQLAASTQRDSLLIAANSRTDPGVVRQDAEQTLQELNITVLDVLVVQYILPGEELRGVSFPGEAALRVAQELKSEGVVRYVAASTHSFDLAATLARSGLVDALMLRYNMAHRTVENDSFPAALECNIPILSFTSTRWNTLQGGHTHWSGPLPSTGDCIGFALSHPAVAHNISSLRTLEEVQDTTQRLVELAQQDGEEREAELRRWRYAKKVV